MTFTRRQLSKLTAAISDFWDGCVTKDEFEISSIFWNAIRNLDYETLSHFARFGPSVRHQIMNMNWYQHGLRFGFKEIILDEYGWLDNDRWKNEEEVLLRVTADKHFAGNGIRLAQGLNGKWTYGMSYSYGMSGGGGYNPHVYGPIFSSRDECLQEGLKKLRAMFEAKENDSPHKYLRAVLSKIEETEKSVRDYQLALF